jgi:HPt (histidine-containing phosphotransfer) domain-containing protein
MACAKIYQGLVETADGGSNRFTFSFVNQEITMSEDQTIEMPAIDALRELSPDAGQEFLRELIEIFLQDTPQRMAELEEALGKNDVPGFTRAAHTIKGSSSNFGATKFTKLAHELEMQGKSGDLSDAAAWCSRLKAEYILVGEALSKISQGV